MLVEVLTQSQLLDMLQSVITMLSTLERLGSNLSSDIYTEEELVKTFKTSRFTLRKLTREGKLRFSKVGRRIIYTNEDVMNYLRRDFATHKDKDSNMEK